MRLALALGLFPELVRKRTPLFQGPQRTAERLAQVFVKGQGHGIGRISVADVAAITDEVSFVDFPDVVDHDKRTFECKACSHVVIEVVKYR